MYNPYSNKQAEVVVLIPHYNNNEKLVESVLSIDEEIQIDVLIVDDGSKIKPDLASLKSLYCFGNVYLEKIDQNMGIEHALNKGLDVIEKLGYKYIARLDCGDLNKKNKYSKQFTYLEKNLNISLLGTWADIVNENGTYLYQLKHPISYEKIKKHMYKNSMFIHPTVMYRANILPIIGKYPINYKAAEDYAFFFNIVNSFEASNYPESLLIYEMNSNSISSSKRNLQIKNRIRIILKNFYFGIFPIYGLIRNFIILILPFALINHLKKYRK